MKTIDLSTKYRGLLFSIMEMPSPDLYDKGDIFQVNPDFQELIGWSLIVACEIFDWGIEGVLFTDLEILWLREFQLKKKIKIEWEYLEFLGHIRLGREYENADIEKEG